jgi:mannose-6-phosphate isomerase-like protein (cupin superfamily)
VAVPAFANARGGSERLVFGGTTITIRASADTTGDAFTVFEESAPLLDTSAHVHRDEDELYYVIEGDHLFVCGGDEHRLGPGGMVFLPRGVPHAHRRVVPGAGRLLSMTSPAGFEGFFRVLAEADRRGDDLAAAYVTASQQYGITWLDG